MHQEISNGFPITAIVLAIIAFAAVTLMNTTTTEISIKKEVLKSEAKVELSDLMIVTDQYSFTDRELVVTPKNITSETKSFGVHIETIDSS